MMTLNLRHWTELIVFAAAFAVAVPAHARDRALQAACFAPETLSAVAGENVPADHRYDTYSAKVELQPAAPVPAGLRGSIRRVELPKGSKLIALTLDLCEDRGEVAGYDGRIFDYLRRENVKATLFAGGKWLRSHLSRTEQLMTDPLFEIGNHAEAHRNLRKLDGRPLSDEISGPARAYENIRAHLATTQCAAKAPEGIQSVAPRLGLFRFPFGACNPTAMVAVNDAGLLAIQWDVSSGDPDPHMSAGAIAEQIVRHVKPGSIVIGHANGRGWHTAEALPIAIPKLKALGYEFVTVSELLAAGKPMIADTCYDSRPGDTDRYDFIAGLHGRQKPLLPWQSTVSGALETSAATPASPPRPTRKANREQPDGANWTLWPF
jgi:peptidoglycan-N-acetylglucosamine deacetylase